MQNSTSEVNVLVFASTPPPSITSSPSTLTSSQGLLVSTGSCALELWNTEKLQTSLWRFPCCLLLHEYWGCEDCAEFGMFCLGCSVGGMFMKWKADNEVGLETFFFVFLNVELEIIYNYKLNVKIRTMAHIWNVKLQDFNFSILFRITTTKWLQRGLFIKNSIYQNSIFKRQDWD